MNVTKNANMFVLEHEGENIGRLIHNVHNDYIDAVFIGVKEEFRGTKAKNYLLDELLKLADETGLKISCTCSWMQRWFTKHHPEYLK